MFPTVSQCLPFAAVPPGIAVDLVIGSAFFWALGLATVLAVVTMIGSITAPRGTSRRGRRAAAPLRVVDAKA